MTRSKDLSQLKDGFLEGHLLIAMPSMGDPRFERAVIYMCAHSAEGAMGLIINQPSQTISFPDLLEQLDILPENRQRARDIKLENMKVLVGGPVETGRGFVLHSEDYFSDDSSLAIQDGVCLTATIDILKAIAAGSGPKRSLLALGYAGWAPGQLESEIQANGWLNCPADAELIFASDLQVKYQRAMAKLGIDPTHLVSDAGHA